jgi:hypothetical protein
MASGARSAEGRRALNLEKNDLENSAAVFCLALFVIGHLLARVFIV